MKFRVNANVFAKILTPVFDVSTKKGIKDFETNNLVCVTANSDEIIAKSFNGYTAIKSTLTNLSFSDLKYEFEKEGSVIINIKDFIKILNSFKPGTELAIELEEDNGTRLKFWDVDAESDTQILPVLSNADNMTFPQKLTKENKKITIDKNVFIDGASRILFAHGDQESQRKFMNWVLRVDKDAEKIRFGAGTGGIFAFLDTWGKDFLTTNKSCDFLFPNKQTAIFLSVISATKYDKIDIIEKVNDDLSSSQIVIDCQDHEIILIGLNSGMDWVDEGRFLDKTKEYKVVTKTSDWLYPMKGILATVNDDVKRQSDPHGVEISFDDANKNIFLNADYIMKSSRKIDFIESKVINGQAFDEKYNFISKTFHVNQVIDKFNKDYSMQIEVIDSRSPILVYDFADQAVSDSAPSRLNEKTGLMESFFVFFTTMLEK